MRSAEKTRSCAINLAADPLVERHLEKRSSVPRGRERVRAVATRCRSSPFGCRSFHDWREVSSLRAFMGGRTDGLTVFIGLCQGPAVPATCSSRFWPCVRVAKKGLSDAPELSSDTRLG